MPEHRMMAEFTSRIRVMLRTALVMALVAIVATGCAFAAIQPPAGAFSALFRGRERSLGDSSPGALAEMPAEFAQHFQPHYVLGELTYYHVPNAMPIFQWVAPLLLAFTLVCALLLIFLASLITGWRKRWLTIPILFAAYGSLHMSAENLMWAEARAVHAPTWTIEVAKVDNLPPAQREAWLATCAAERLRYPQTNCARLNIDTNQRSPSLADQAHFVLGQIAYVRQDSGGVAEHVAAISGAWHPVDEHSRMTLGVLVDQAMHDFPNRNFKAAEAIAQGRPYRSFWNRMFWLSCAIAALASVICIGLVFICLKRSARIVSDRTV
jgi:hypothetical protein